MSGLFGVVVGADDYEDGDDDDGGEGAGVHHNRFPTVTGITVFGSRHASGRFMSISGSLSIWLKV